MGFDVRNPGDAGPFDWPDAPMPEDGACITQAPLPCPFCGSEPHVIKDDSYTQCAVGCNDCELEPSVSGHRNDLDRVIAIWNTRAWHNPADVIAAFDDTHAHYKAIIASKDAVIKSLLKSSQHSLKDDGQGLGGGHNKVANP